MKLILLYCREKLFTGLAAPCRRVSVISVLKNRRSRNHRNSSTLNGMFGPFAIHTRGDRGCNASLKQALHPLYITMLPKEPDDSHGRLHLPNDRIGEEVRVAVPEALLDYLSGFVLL
jgi:hypothetical protein